MSKINDKKKVDNLGNNNTVEVPALKNLSFEDCLKKVEMLSDELESGGLPLNDALKKYKLAVSVMNRAGDLLNIAKNEIEVIDNNGENLVSRQEFLNK